MAKYAPTTLSDAVLTCRNDRTLHIDFCKNLKMFLNRDISYLTLRQNLYSHLDGRLFSNWGAGMYVATSKVLYELCLAWADSIGKTEEEVRTFLIKHSPDDALNSYFYEGVGADDIAYLKRNASSIRDTRTPVSPVASSTTSQSKESTMADAKNAVETITFVYGTDAKDVTEDNIFTHIANLEGQIKNLEAIETKPKALVAKIESLRADIAALVKISDDRQPA